VARVDWSDVSDGKTVLPVLLIHGLPGVFFPEGYTTASSVTFTSPDALWWPGTSSATLSTYGKPWLSLSGEGFAWTERANPADSSRLDLASLTARIADLDDAATAMFASRDLATGTFITAEVTAADTSISVVSTAGFASSGVIYLGREAISYSGVTGTSFTGCGRGAFGSEAQRHFFSASSGYGLGNPEVTSIPVEIVGRLATLWMVQKVGSALTALSLQYVGHIGTGPLLPEGDGGGWSLSIDHAVKRLSQRPRAPTVQIAGYSHTGNSGARSAFVVGGVNTYGHGLVRDGLSPVVDTYSDTASTDVRYVVALTDDAASPDNGGWHATRESYVAALNEAAASVVSAGDSITYALDADGHLQAMWTFASARGASGWWSWEGGSEHSPTTTFTQTSSRVMPEAWVPIVGTRSRIYLSDTDYATVPPVPSPAPSDAFCRWALVWDEQGAEGASPVKRAVYVNSATSSGGVNYLTVVPLVGSRYLPPASGLGTVSFRGRNGILVTTPTTARVVLYVNAESWVPALRSAVTVFSDDLGDAAAQVFDWDRIASVATLYAPTIQGRREYIIDADTTVLALVANECALQGFSLVPYRGRIAIARIGDFASSETRAAELTSADLTADSIPGYARGMDGVVNTMQVDFPAARTKFTFVDQTNRAAYGPSRETINVTVPAGLFDRAIDGALMTDTIAAVAMSAIGPLRRPYESVPIECTLRHADLAVGDLCGLTLWRVPDGSGSRGLIDRTAQVMERSPVLFREGSEGLVRFTLRLNPTDLQGWAPGAIVAAGGITGAAITLDTTTFGATGCAQTGTDGGASLFSPGDKVRLVEIGNASPATAIQREVLSVAGAVVTLTATAGATFAALAVDAMKVAIMYDDWDVVADAQLPGWAYLANTSNRLVDGAVSTRARVYA
jgi:hypothetical protein